MLMKYCVDGFRAYYIIVHSVNLFIVLCIVHETLITTFTHKLLGVISFRISSAQAPTLVSDLDMPADHLYCIFVCVHSGHTQCFTSEY